MTEDMAKASSRALFPQRLSEIGYRIEQISPELMERLFVCYWQEKLRVPRVATSTIIKIVSELAPDLELSAPAKGLVRPGGSKIPL